MRLIAYVPFLFMLSCFGPEKPSFSLLPGDTARNETDKDVVKVQNTEKGQPLTSIATGNTTPEELITFARSLTGTPYKYGSTDPRQGFDCSGFVTYVFNHFGITVPRSSVGFTAVQREIDIKDVKPGDLILFTGTDSRNRTVGHMGIFTSGAHEELKFIHSTSGKAFGVTETPLNNYYQGRYVKSIRIFSQNDQ